MAQVLFMLVLTIRMDSGMLYEEVLDHHLTGEDCIAQLETAWFSDVLEGTVSCQVDGLATIFNQEGV